MAKKKRVGRPAKKKTAVLKNNPKKASRKPQKAQSGAEAALSAHGLARWQPQAGDQLITQSIGSMTYSGRSWRKSSPAAAAPKRELKAGATSGAAKKRGRPSKVVVEQVDLNAKRRPGRPRKTAPVPMQQARKGQRGRRVVEEVVIKDIDALDELVSSVA